MNEDLELLSKLFNHYSKTYRFLVEALDQLDRLGHPMADTTNTVTLDCWIVEHIAAAEISTKVAKRLTNAGYNLPLDYERVYG